MHLNDAQLKETAGRLLKIQHQLDRIAIKLVDHSVERTEELLSGIENDILTIKMSFDVYHKQDQE